MHKHNIYISKHKLIIGWTWSYPTPYSNFEAMIGIVRVLVGKVYKIKSQVPFLSFQ